MNKSKRELKSDRKWTQTYPTGDDNPSNNRDKRSISDPSLPLKRHQIGEESSEERRCRTDCLIEGYGKVPKGNITTDDGATKNKAERRDFKELGSGFEHLKRHNLENNNGEVAKNRAGGHMAHCEEDWESEAIIG